MGQIKKAVAKSQIMIDSFTRKRTSFVTNTELKLIAHDLLVRLRKNVSVDWAHRDSARARLRVLVKRILRKYGYTPDLQVVAVQTVLQQAEALPSSWTVSRGGAV